MSTRTSRPDAAPNDNNNVVPTQPHVGPRVRHSPLQNASDSSPAAAPPNAHQPDRDVVQPPAPQKTRDDFTVDIRVAAGPRRPIAESAGGVASASDGDVKSLTSSVAAMNLKNRVISSTSVGCRDARRPSPREHVNAEDFLQVTVFTRRH